MVPCRVIYLFGQGKGYRRGDGQMRGAHWGGAPRFLKGARAPMCPPPSDAPDATGQYILHRGTNKTNNNNRILIRSIKVLCDLLQLVNSEMRSQRDLSLCASCSSRQYASFECLWTSIIRFAREICSPLTGGPSGPS